MNECPDFFIQILLYFLNLNHLTENSSSATYLSHPTYMDKPNIYSLKWKKSTSTFSIPINIFLVQFLKHCNNIIRGQRSCGKIWSWWFCSWWWVCFNLEWQLGQSHLSTCVDKKDNFLPHKLELLQKCGLVYLLK